MATIDDGLSTNRPRYPLNHLRLVLQEARDADDAERIHTGLIDAVDGLIAHAERQARAVEELRSDLGYKQASSPTTEEARSESLFRPTCFASLRPARTAIVGSLVVMRRPASLMWSIGQTCHPVEPSRK